jgi:hypothetical protein
MGHVAAISFRQLVEKVTTESHKSIYGALSIIRSARTELSIAASVRRHSPYSDSNDDADYDLFERLKAEPNRAGTDDPFEQFLNENTQVIASDCLKFSNLVEPRKTDMEVVVPLLVAFKGKTAMYILWSYARLLYALFIFTSPEPRIDGILMSG